MPKGGRKGGTRFPRHKLDLAIQWARKLTAKTHVEPQPVDVILVGVVGAKYGEGQVRVSSLKQYGLLEGDPKGYYASRLAKDIVASPEEEIATLKQTAFLLPMTFKSMFTPFVGDEVSRPKLRQRALELKVHPDQADMCVDIYVAGLVASELGSVEGDRIVHFQAPSTGAPSVDYDATDESQSGEELEERENGPDDVMDEPDNTVSRRNVPRAVFNVNVNLDASLDTEKLERQLALLRKYGAI